MAKDDSRYIGVLLEGIREEIKSVHELVADVPTRGEFRRFEEKVDALGEDIRTVKAAVTATNRDVVDLDRRVTRLEGLEAA